MTKAKTYVLMTKMYDAVRSLKHNKSPGPDGLIQELYQKMWEHLKCPFMEMLTETFEKGEMTESTKKSVVFLILTKGEKCNIKNCRPICLTNYDYKIIAFVLAKRLQSVIGKIVHIDQTGYIKGSFIGQSARLVNDVFDYCENFNASGCLICLDYEKA